MNWRELQGAVGKAHDIRNRDIRYRTLEDLLREVGATLPEDSPREERDLDRELNVEIRRRCAVEKGVVPGATVKYGRRQPQEGMVREMMPGGWASVLGAKRVLDPLQLEVVALPVADAR